jgi:hypothetical protein
MERWAIYGRKENSKWIPLFKDNRTYKTKSYANKVFRQIERGYRLSNARVELKVKAVWVDTCPHCKNKLVND